MSSDFFSLCAGIIVDATPTNFPRLIVNDACWVLEKIFIRISNNASFELKTPCTNETLSSNRTRNSSKFVKINIWNDISVPDLSFSLFTLARQISLSFESHVHGCRYILCWSVVSSERMRAVSDSTLPLFRNTNQSYSRLEHRDWISTWCEGLSVALLLLLSDSERASMYSYIDCLQFIAQ